MNIIEWMIEKDIAKNGFQASHISEGLHLPNFDRATQEAKCILYRKWRPKTDKKDMLPTREAYDLTNAGIDPDDVQKRQIELTVSFGDMAEDMLDKMSNFEGEQ